MSFGRFTGGKHFTKKAIKSMNKPISSEQIKQLTSYLGNEFRLDNLTESQASYLLKELKRNKDKTIQRLKTL